MMKPARARSPAARAADDSGSLAETVAAIVVMALSAVMVITFYVTATNVERRERLRADALALIEDAGAAARQIDCVQNAYLKNSGGSITRGLEVCGPEPAAGTNTVVKPAGADVLAGQSGHDLITVEWADYYLLDDMGSCSLPVGPPAGPAACAAIAGAAWTSGCYTAAAPTATPPRAARAVTATWSDGAGIRTMTRTVLGPSVPLTRGWTAVHAPGPAREEYSYILSTPSSPKEAVQIPSYRGCKVLVARVGESRGPGHPVCVLDEGWNAPSGCI